MFERLVFTIAALQLSAALFSHTSQADTPEIIIPFTRGIMTDITTTDVPEKKDIISSIDFIAARDEFEPFS